MNQKKKVITVLGCGGFIGSHLIAGLLSANKYKIFGVDLKSDKIKKFLGNTDFEFLESNIYTNPTVVSCIENSEIVISLAALCNPSMYNTIPVEVIESNFIQPVEIIKLCSNLKKWLIHFSTSEVYGKTVLSQLPSGIKEVTVSVDFAEDSTPLILGPVQAQRWSYACAKQLSERLIYAYAQQKGLEYTIIRPFNFIGPGMDYIPGIDGEGVPRVLACFMESLMFKKPLQLVDEGKNLRVFTYIDDAIDAIMRIIECQAKGHIFNIGNPDNEMSIEMLAYQMIRIYKELFPESPEYCYSVKNVDSNDFYGPGYEDSDRRIPDISKAKKILGWTPQVNLETTLRKTIKMFAENYTSELEIQLYDAG
jgi:UDP-apiose/xylose synthase